MRYLISDLLCLLNSGRLRATRRFSVNQSIRGTLYAFVVSYILNIMLVSIVWAVTNYFNILIPENITIRGVLDKSTLDMIVTVVIIAPILEEFIFRINLRHSILNLSLFLAAITYLLTGVISDYVISIWIRLIMSFFLWIIYYELFVELFDRNIQTSWNRYSLIFFYVSLFSFGFSHIFNYQLSCKLLIYLPIITLPQTISGITLAYIRIKYGILYSILLHSTSNAFSLLLGIILVNKT